MLLFSKLIDDFQILQIVQGINQDRLDNLNCLKLAYLDWKKTKRKTPTQNKGFLNSDSAPQHVRAPFF